jgi:MFS family permease
VASLTYIQLLRSNRSFRRLWLGQVVSELGNWFFFIATLGLVRQVSKNDVGATTIVLMARLIPFTLFAPLAGAVVDRLSRRAIMIVTDLARAVVALLLLLVHDPSDLWIAYICTVLLSFFGAFFEAAKNAAVPNITGDRDLLAGNALMFSSRFLLMSFGAALGGWTASHFGYQVAFIVNFLSFLVSAFSVWLIPERETRQEVARRTPDAVSLKQKPGYWSDIREGWAYIISNGAVAAIIGINILWATGGGAINLISDRLGGVVFAGKNGISGDSAVAILYFAAGMGLFVGMMIARRVGTYLELRGKTVAFIGWTLILQGILFAGVGLMPTVFLAGFMLFLARVTLGVEFAIQETLLMKLVPDYLRGRVSTTDRAAEILVWSFSTAIAGWSLRVITPRMLTVLSGLLSASGGITWLVLFALKRVTLPPRLDESLRRRTEVAST